MEKSIPDQPEPVTRDLRAYIKDWKNTYEEK